MDELAQEDEIVRRPHFMLVNEMPHGGLKQPGYGKDMSLYALEDHTAVRHVLVKHG